MSAEAPSLIPVSPMLIQGQNELAFDLYVQANQDQPRLFCAARIQPDTASIDQLLKDGVTRLYIKATDRNAYQSHLRDNWRSIVSAETSVAPVERASATNQIVREILREQFASGCTQKLVESSKAVAAATVESLTQAPIMVQQLCNVLHHDYGTFTHSTNVAAYAVLLGHNLGYCEEELQQIAAGALLHDIGKIDIADKILNKPGRLDDFERREIEKHPTLGLQRVSDRHDLSFGQFMMIYQHHERLNGTGYPVGSEASEIHPWAQLCAVVDVFEALTSIRPYRSPMTIDTAMAVLERGLGTEFNAEMLVCWKALLFQ